MLRVILIGILIVIGLWALYMSIGFVLVWGPPVFATAILFSIPAVQTRVAAVYFKKHGIGGWTSERTHIVGTLKTLGFTFLVILGLTLLLLFWIGIAGYPALSLGLKFKDPVLQDYFVGQADSARSMRLFFTVIPCALSLVVLIPFTRILVARRVEKIAERLEGSDTKTGDLRQLDAQISACLHELGSSRRSRYADEFQTWRASHIRAVIRYTGEYKREFTRLHGSATRELENVARCCAKFRRVKEAYQSGLVRLRRSGSVALLASLEDAGRTLLSDAFVHLVDAGRWQDIENFLQEVNVELGQLDKIADGQAEDSTYQAPPAASRMTRDLALELLALPKLCSREDIERRRKEMAKIHHPDRAGADDELRNRNQETMKKINEACDFLLMAS